MAPKTGKQGKALISDEVTGVLGEITEVTYWRGADSTETAVQISRSDFGIAIENILEFHDTSNAVLNGCENRSLPEPISAVLVLMNNSQITGYLDNWISG